MVHQPSDEQRIATRPAVHSGDEIPLHGAGHKHRSTPDAPRRVGDHRNDQGEKHSETGGPLPDAELIAWVRTLLDAILPSPEAEAEAEPEVEVEAVAAE